MNALTTVPSVTASVPVSVDAELIAALSFAEQEKSAATRRAYRSDWQIFIARCSARDLEPLPAAPETVARFLSSQATAGMKASTKRHLRIKRFYGTSKNAVKTQIWIAVSIYVLVAIVRMRLRLQVSLYTLLQVHSVTVFEKMPIRSAGFTIAGNSEQQPDDNQLNLYTF